MTAISISDQGRPVIALTKTHTNSSWYLFELAHEIGHIALGHLEKNGIMIDEKLDMASNEALEKEADEFALSILEGNDLINYYPKDKLNPANLYGLALGISNKFKINIGFVILHYANQFKDYRIGNTTLKLIKDEFAPSEFFYRKISKYSILAKDIKENSELLKKLSGKF